MERGDRWVGVGDGGVEHGEGLGVRAVMRDGAVQAMGDGGVGRGSLVLICEIGVSVGEHSLFVGRIQHDMSYG